MISATDSSIPVCTAWRSIEIIPLSLIVKVIRSKLFGWETGIGIKKVFVVEILNPGLAKRDPKRHFLNQITSFEL